MPHAPSPRVYVRYARCAFQRRAVYRLANLTGIAVNFFFFLIHAQVFIAFFGSKRTVAGWQAHEAVLYFATSEALLMVLGVMSAAVGMELIERVRSGDVVVDLARPVRLWARHLAECYGTSAYFVLARAIVLYLAAIWLYQVAPPLALRLLWVPASVAMGIGIAALLFYAASATGYWIENARGPVRVVMFAGFLFGGIVVPLDFYPDAVRMVSDVLPFRGAIYTPIALATGKLAGGDLVFGLAHQAVWLLALAALSHVLEVRGSRRLAALGG